MSIYSPQEDSYLLSKFIKETVKEYSPKKILDMGSGSGIQGDTVLKSGIKPEDLTLVDINKDAIKILKKKFPKSKVIHSNLFQKVKGGVTVRGTLAPFKYDLIIFNPPYLPENKFDKERDTTGGKKGSEVINKFLKQAKSHLTKNGNILLLTSSFTKGIDYKGYKKKLLGKKGLFFERLFVWRLSISNY